MPNTIAQFDDELQTIAGTLTDATAGGRQLLNRAADQVTAPKARVTPSGRRSRPRIDIDGGRPVPTAAPPNQGPSGRRNASAAARRRGGTPPAHRGGVRGRRRAASVMREGS